MAKLRNFWVREKERSLFLSSSVKKLFKFLSKRERKELVSFIERKEIIKKLGMAHDRFICRKRLPTRFCFVCNAYAGLHTRPCDCAAFWFSGTAFLYSGTAIWRCEYGCFFANVYVIICGKFAFLFDISQLSRYLCTRKQRIFNIYMLPITKTAKTFKISTKWKQPRCDIEAFLFYITKLLVRKSNYIGGSKGKELTLQHHFNYC